MRIWKRYCPMMKGICINGFVKGMPENESGERDTCAFFITLAGKDPQTGEAINDPGCSVHFLPLIILEGNQFARQGVASTDKVATEIRHHHASFIGALTHEARDRILEAHPILKALPGEKQ